MTEIAAYEDIRSENLSTDFREADYLYYVAQVVDLPEDFVICLSNILLPTLRDVDGYALVENIGAPARYEKYRKEGQTPPQAQYWANNLVVTSLIGELDDRAGMMFANCIRVGWQESLNAFSTKIPQYVRIIPDDDGIYITIDTNWA